MMPHWTTTRTRVRLVSDLSARGHSPLALRYVADLTPKQIAARTGNREGTVKSRLHYALRQMRAALDAADRAQGGWG